MVRQRLFSSLRLLQPHLRARVPALSDQEGFSAINVGLRGWLYPLWGRPDLRCTHRWKSCRRSYIGLYHFWLYHDTTAVRADPQAPRLRLNIRPVVWCSFGGRSHRGRSFD